MTAPDADPFAHAVDALTEEVRKMRVDIAHSDGVRTTKIEAIRNLMWVVVPALILLLAMTITNLIQIRGTGETVDQVRQTGFVIALCQRQNPSALDPSGAGMVACVQEYFPDFRLPDKAQDR